MLLQMGTTEIILELLKYVLPAGLVMGAVTLVMRENRHKVEIKAKYAVFKGSMDKIVPIRLQAYERGILFLERISPENLLLRIDGRELPVGIYHKQLTMEIRAEFEHNVAQQLYIDSESWAAIVRAKEQTIALINQTARSLPQDAVGTELGKRVLNEMVRQESAPAREGIVLLKRDISKMFRFSSAVE